VEVLRRRADHRRPPDVDVLDHLLVGHAAPARGPLERIQVYAHQVDELDVVFLGRPEMGGVVAHGQQSGVQLRMQRLDAAVHDLGKPV